MWHGEASDIISKIGIVNDNHNQRAYLIFHSNILFQKKRCENLRDNLI